MAAHWAPSSMVHRIAHRGASHYAPANSPEAVAAAARHGATDVEVDVHSCADGRLVVTHDGTVQVGGVRWISQLTSGDYAAALAETGEQPTFLEHIFEAAAAAGLGVYLDIKQLLPGHERVLGEVVAQFGYDDRVVAASFRSDLALTVKRATGLRTSVLFYDPDLDLQSLVAGTGCDFVHPCFDVFPDPMAAFTDEWRAAAAATGAGIICWNTASVDHAMALLRAGVDGICADDPEVLVEAQRQVGTG